MFPLNQNSGMSNPQQAFFQALQAHNAGLFSEAEGMYRAILGKLPNQPEVNFHLGRLLVQTNRAQNAQSHLEKAASLLPQSLDAWQLLIETQVGLGLKKQAKRSLKRAAANRFTASEMQVLSQTLQNEESQSTTALGTVPKAEVDRAVMLFQNGNLKAAESLVDALLASHPGVAFLCNFKGVMRMQDGAFREAAEYFLDATKADPRFADGFGNLGRALFDLSLFEQAADALKTALKLAPKMASAHLNMGEVQMALAAYDAALRSFSAALQLQPDSIDAQIGRAKAMGAKGESAASLTAFRAVLPRLATDAQRELVLGEIGNALRHAEDYAMSRSELLAALADFPQSENLRISLAQTQAVLGEFKAAEDGYLSVIADNPRNAAAFLHLSRIRKWTKEDPVLAQMLDALDPVDFNLDTGVEAGFALAKAMEDTGQYQKVFGYLNAANAAMRRNLAYYHDQVKADFDTMKAHYDKAFFDTLATAACDDAAPIFIVGMPRSGTTMTEQILSSHPEVSGAGETGDFVAMVVNEIKGKSASFLPANRLKPNMFRRKTRTVVEAMKQRAGGRKFVTDKTPHTFVVIGFLLSLLPNAKVIHVFRNPVDTCLSIYKNRFIDGTHSYANNQKELADYYVMYDDMMDHWRRMFPDRMIEVDYDKLVSDPDREIRSMIAAAGLDWNEACLHPERNDRAVSTLSVFQSRQKISSGSSRMWKRYESDLADITGVFMAHPRLKDRI